MSDVESTVEEKPFCVERAKQGRAACKKCKEKCLQGEIRIGKLAASPYGDGKMKMWHHLDCLFEQFLKQRPNTKRMESSGDLDGFEALSGEDQAEITNKFVESEKLIAEKYHKPYSPKKFHVPKLNGVKPSNTLNKKVATNKDHKDNAFREFRRLIAEITNVSSYTDKTALISNLLKQGTDGAGFKGDIALWVKLLLPGIEKRIYNLQSKQLIKLFRRIFHTDLNDMLEDLEQGDIGETIQSFYEKSSKLKPPKKSQLTLFDVDAFLEELSKLSKEDEQSQHFKSFISKCTANDLKIIIRLIKHDLRMNAGAKHVLEGVHVDAYKSYQSSRDIKSVIERCLSNDSNTTKATIGLLTPVLPMLAEACKSVEQAMKKCPNGMFSEIKYDGERVQVHKKGNEFRYYSRSLKPVMEHKVRHFKDFIPKAFPHGKDLILDSEILMIDTITGKPLPFGTLGKHKKHEFENATVCLFVFDCIYYNDEILTNKPLKERKRILKENMNEIENHVMFSEMQEIHKPKDLAHMIAKVLKLGLEGLVLKDIEGLYNPGKRHWLKVKKDYLLDGAMADTADLIVLGAWYGTGKKGGMMSVFLMGVHEANQFYTVTKVHTGHDDKTLEKLQKDLDMIKISGDINKVPNWLKCTKTMIPDFVAKDPKNQPIWEITGAEFTQQHDVHTANGISIRFPRVTKIRDDKNWETATNLQELNVLFKNSKEHFDANLLTTKMGFDNHDENEDLFTKTELPKTDNKLKADEYTNSDDSTKINDISKQSNKRKADESTSTNINYESNIPKQSKKCKIETLTNSDESYEIVNPLPIWFDSMYLLLADERIRDDYSEIIRYFKTCAGTVLEPGENEQATHVLYDKEWIAEEYITCPNSALHITYKYIVDSLQNEGMLTNIHPYLVKLIPSKRETKQ